ncbi:MAG TPA: hypothetical protein VGG84_18190 [Gemmatimonadaceae bacterium]
MPDRFVLPELARSLRAFGAASDAASEAAHGAIFTPLLDARARAATSDVHTALASLRGEALAARITARVADVAQAGIDDAPFARARSAVARELLQPLRAELGALDLLAPTAAEGQWTPWIEQLRRVFAVADECCRAFARLLREPPTPMSKPRGRGHWFGLGGR